MSQTIIIERAAIGNNLVTVRDDCRLQQLCVDRYILENPTTAQMRAPGNARDHIDLIIPDGDELTIQLAFGRALEVATHQGAKSVAVPGLMEHFNAAGSAKAMMAAIELHSMTNNPPLCITIVSPLLASYYAVALREKGTHLNTLFILQGRGAEPAIELKA